MNIFAVDHDDTAYAVHIVCSVFNGARYLNEFMKSLQSQSVGNWRLWVRDDGSSDDSQRLLNELKTDDARIRLVDSRGNIGVVPSFARTLDAVPAEARYIMFADQDDIWLPIKIEYTLKAMMLAEETARGPVLVHSDMKVVDENLHVIDESFWHLAHLNPEAHSLRQLAARNIVTGATVMINRALRERVGTIPREAAMHDWWIACVASGFGKLVAISTPTMLYRQHGANTVGARKPGSNARWLELPGAVRSALHRTSRVRRDIATAAAQAHAFLERYENELSASDRTFLEKYAQIPSRHLLRRKLDIARLHLQRDDNLLKNAGLLLRA